MDLGTDVLKERSGSPSVILRESLTPIQRSWRHLPFRLHLLLFFSCSPLQDATTSWRDVQIMIINVRVSLFYRRVGRSVGSSTSLTPPLSSFSSCACVCICGNIYHNEGDVRRGWKGVDFHPLLRSSVFLNPCKPSPSSNQISIVHFYNLCGVETRKHEAVD